MANLIERSPCDGLLPVSGAGTLLEEVLPGPVTSVSPRAGKARALAAALKPLGLRPVEPGRSLRAAGHQLFWSGQDLMFLIGAPPAELGAAAAVTDQSDAWAVMRLAGPAAEAVLARLVPVDLRAAQFPVDAVARTGLNHMVALIRRVAADALEIWVFRSMAGTAVHEIATAMKAIAAREGA